MEEQTVRTIDHDEIREWVEERGGTPAVVAETHGEDGGGILRIDFGEGDEDLEGISWEEFFRIFDKNDLAFLYQEELADGTQSFFNKLVARNENEEDFDDGDLGEVFE